MAKEGKKIIIGFEPGGPTSPGSPAGPRRPKPGMPRGPRRVLAISAKFSGGEEVSILGA